MRPPMEPTLIPRVKVCCISSIEEMRLAVRHGAWAIGLVAAMPSGPGVIPEPTICAIAAATPPPIATFLLTSHQRVDDIIAQHRRCRANTLQLVDALTEGTYADLRAALPGIAIVQVIHVTGEHSVDEAIEAASHKPDALLLDSGDPRLAVKLLGGTGRTHNWDLSRTIRESIDIPLLLAGGLRPDNVHAALDAVGPFAVDVCSGLRTDGHLDEAKLTHFMSEVRRWTARATPSTSPPESH
jgi:phosphoribosylanthranilate isomerase